MAMTAEQRQLIQDSEISVIVFGRAGDFVSIRLDIDSPEDARAMQDVINRNLPFIGVLGFRDGKPEVKCQPDLDAIYTCMHAGMSFGHDIAAHLRQQQGDACAWLTRLHALPDNRA